MDKYKTKEITDQNIWEKYVLSCDPKSFLHSWNWGETQKLLGKYVYRFGIYENSKIKGVCLMVLEDARRGKHFVIPGGPFVDWSKRDLVATLILEVKRVAKIHNVWFVRIRPELLDDDGNGFLFRRLGLVKSPMHLHAQNTWMLDITLDEEELLSGMRKNTRYAVRKSLQSGLKITSSVKLKDAQILTRLQEETVRRNKFVGFSNKMFESQLKTFGINNQARLFIVKKGKVPLVSAIIVFYGDCAYYHHSASSDKARETNASYFLQWEVIKYAKKLGCKTYNFWGVSPKRDPNHRFHGVTVFKTGFGGSQTDWLPAYDMPISRLYWLTHIFEHVRKRLRHL